MITKDSVLTSWRTSLAGLVASLGLLLMQGVTWQSVLAAVGTALCGLAASDHAAIHPAALK